MTFDYESFITQHLWIILNEKLIGYLLLFAQAFAFHLRFRIYVVD